jgi:hypothetical protein
MTIDKYQSAIRARAFLDVAINGLYKAQSELIGSLGRLNDDLRAVVDVIQAAERLADRLDSQIRRSKP